MHVILFANGRLDEPPTDLPRHDLLIAADGGASHLQALGRQPDVLIGDLDSLDPGWAEIYRRAGVEIIEHPAAKDETDLELAMNYASSRGATRISLYGLLGGRWDMTFANLLLLAAPAYRHIRFRVWAAGASLYILHGGDSLSLQGRPGDPVSVIPLGGDAIGVTYQGLAWPLQDAVLPYATPRGVSNSMLANEAVISLKTGVLLCVHAHTQPDRDE